MREAYWARAVLLTPETRLADEEIAEAHSLAVVNAASEASRPISPIIVGDISEYHRRAS